MEEVNSRLAGILAADVVGYSAKMGADDADTLARVYLQRRATAHVDSPGCCETCLKAVKERNRGFESIPLHHPVAPHPIPPVPGPSSPNP